MNSVVLTGNLTKDVETKTTNTGKAVATITLAFNHNKDEVSFFDCIAFDKKAELLRDYCHKGSKILIRGELKQDRWQDKDGAKKSAVRVLISEIEFLSSKDQENAQTSQNAPVEDTSATAKELPF